MFKLYVYCTSKANAAIKLYGKKEQKLETNSSNSSSEKKNSFKASKLLCSKKPETFLRTKIQYYAFLLIFLLFICFCFGTKILYSFMGYCCVLFVIGNAEHNFMQNKKFKHIDIINCDAILKQSTYINSFLLFSSL